jgi:hypothetical protein
LPALPKRTGGFSSNAGLIASFPLAIDKPPLIAYEYRRIGFRKISAVIRNCGHFEPTRCIDGPAIVALVGYEQRGTMTGRRFGCRQPKPGSICIREVAQLPRQTLYFCGENGVPARFGASFGLYNRGGFCLIFVILSGV